MHRHRSLPTTLPLARVGSRLQPTPADQLHHPVPCRLVCHLGSSSMRVGPPPGRQNRGVRSALELWVPRCAASWTLKADYGGIPAAEPGTAVQEIAPQRAGPCRPRLEATHQTKRVHPRGSLACARLTRPRTAVCLKSACSHSGVRMSWKRNRS